MLKLIEIGNKLTYLNVTIRQPSQLSHFTDNNLSIIGSGEIYNNPYTNFSDCILAGYKQWGKELPKHLYGSDWWFIIYDSRTQETFAAVEQYGNICLYYALFNNHLYIARNLAAFKGIIPLNLDVNHLVATTFAGVPADNTSTCFKEVFQLPMGHTLKFVNEAVKVDKYWLPTSIQVQKKARHEDLYQELFELYYQAVEKQLAGAKKPFLMLSGGLDSTSIATLAAKILASKNKQLYTVSHIPGYGPAGETHRGLTDESSHILEITERHENIVHQFINSEDSCPIEGVENFLNIYNNVCLGSINLYWIFDLNNYISHMGGDLCLNGKNGNNALSNSGLVHLLPFYHQIYRKNPRRLVSRFLKPFRTPIHEQIFNKYFAQTYLSPEVISAELKERITSHLDLISSGRSQNESLSSSLSMINQGPLRNYDHIYNHYGFRTKDPTADLRLIEFCLSLPNEMFFGPNGENRYLIRKIMHNHMPHRVLYSNQRGVQSSDIGQKLVKSKKKVRATIETLLENTDFRSLVNIPKLQKTTQSIEQGINISYGEAVFFTRAIILGHFLKNNKLSS